MTDFAGLIHSPAEPLPPHLVAKMLDGFGSASHSYRDTGVLLLQRDGTELARHGRAVKPPAAKFVAVGDVRLDNREDFQRTPAAGRREDLWTAAGVVHGFGIDSGSRLIGDFALALWCPRDRTLRLLRDHFGVRPMYYARVGGALAFASDIRLLLPLDPSLRELDLLRVAQFLESEPPDEERTFYLHIKRLPRGHGAVWERGALQVTRYWSPEDVEPEFRRRAPSQQVDRFRELLIEAVRCRVSGVETPGCFLSGGLDSSAVTCVARELLPREKSLVALSAVFPGIDPPLRQLIDERPYIDAVCELEGIESVRVEGDHLSPIEAMDAILSIHGQPVDPPNAYLDLAMYRLAAEQGVTVVLDGLEGDITISHGVHVFDEYAHRGEWGRFFRESKVLESRLGSRRGTVFRQHGLPHLEHASGGQLLAGLWHVAVSGGFRNAARAVRARLNSAAGTIADPPLPRVVSDELRVAVQAPQAPRPPLFQSERQAHLAFLQKAYVPSIMEFTHANARHFGIEARHPLFDVRLARFAIELDSDLKLRDGWTRYVLRRAMEGIVPDAVRWRPGKATLAPNFDLKMGAKGADELTSILQSAAPQITDFAKMDVLVSEIRRNQYRKVWPALVLALFLKKTATENHKK